MDVECVICGDSVGNDAEWVGRGSPVCGSWCRMFLLRGEEPVPEIEVEVTFDSGSDELTILDEGAPELEDWERQNIKSFLNDVTDDVHVTGVVTFRNGDFWDFRET